MGARFWLKCQRSPPDERHFISSPCRRARHSSNPRPVPPVLGQGGCWGEIPVPVEAFLVKVEIQDDIPILRGASEREVHEITMPQGHDPGESRLLLGGAPSPFPGRPWLLRQSWAPASSLQGQRSTAPPKARGLIVMASPGLGSFCSFATAVYEEASSSGSWTANDMLWFQTPGNQTASGPRTGSCTGAFLQIVVTAAGEKEKPPRTACHRLATTTTLGRAGKSWRELLLLLLLLTANLICPLAGIRSSDSFPPALDPDMNLSYFCPNPVTPWKSSDGSSRSRDGESPRTDIAICSGHCHSSISMSPSPSPFSTDLPPRIRQLQK